jgi:hypothetical protein
MTLQELKKICKRAMKCPELDPTLKPEIALALIEALEKANEALSYYGNDGHIRDYENGQLVILQPEEVDDLRPNKALETLNQIKQILEIV